MTAESLVPAPVRMRRRGTTDGSYRRFSLPSGRAMKPELVDESIEDAVRADREGRDFHRDDDEGPDEALGSKIEGPEEAEVERHEGEEHPDEQHGRECHGHDADGDMRQDTPAA